MLSIVIDNPQVESYFANSADELKRFLERFVRDDLAYTKENEWQYKEAIVDLKNKKTVSSSEARSIIGV